MPVLPSKAECIAADPYSSLDCYRLIFYLERENGYIGSGCPVYYVYLDKSSTDVKVFQYQNGADTHLSGYDPTSIYMTKADGEGQYYTMDMDNPSSLGYGVYSLTYDTYAEEFPQQNVGHGSSIYWVDPDLNPNTGSTPVICYSDLPVLDPNYDPEYEPTSDDEYFFAKLDGFTMTFGATVNEHSYLHRPEDGDQNKYYLTNPYQPKIRFTSPVSNTTYEWDANIFTKFQQWVPTYEMNYDSVDPGTYSMLVGKEKAIYYEKNLPALEYKCIQGSRNLDGSWSYNNVDNITYQDMTNHSSEQTITLGQLVEYGKTINPSFSGEDVFTEINMDFYSKFPGTPAVLAGTKTLDYSSLQGSGIDPTTSNGTGGGEGTSWNPMPSYDQDGQSDPNLNGEEVISDDLNQPKVSPYGKFHKTYLLSAAQVDALGDVLTTTDDSTLDAIVDGLKMWGQNPIDAIVDLRMYPFDVASKTGSSAIDTIMLGRYDTEIPAIKMADAPICSIYLGAITVPSYYNNFLDFEPYTTIRLSIPYIGTLDLPPSLFTNHVVSVNLIVDFYTGACTAVIYRDKHIVMQQEGVIGTSIAISGDSAANYANGIIGNIVGTIGSAAGAVANIISPIGNTPGAVSDVINAAGGIKSTIDSFNDVNFQQAGSTSPAVGTWMPQYCKLIIARPKVVYEDSASMARYGMVVGYACNYATTVGSLENPGIYYGIVNNHTGAWADEPAATPKEIEMIRQRLNDGFFIGVLNE